jgi:hypothetical protein
MDELTTEIYEAAYYFHYGDPRVDGSRTPDRDEEMTALAAYVARRLRDKGLV